MLNNCIYLSHNVSRDVKACLHFAQTNHTQLAYFYLRASSNYNSRLVVNRS